MGEKLLEMLAQCDTGIFLYWHGLLPELTLYLIIIFIGIKGNLDDHGLLGVIGYRVQNWISKDP